MVALMVGLQNLMIVQVTLLWLMQLAYCTFVLIGLIKYDMFKEK
jgi:hypothetical protein